MKVIHIHTKEQTPHLKHVQDAIEDGKDVYLMVYMEGCPACERAHPIWETIPEALKKQDGLDTDPIVWVDLNQAYLSDPGNTFVKQETLEGFPTFLLLGKEKNQELKSAVSPDTDVFVNWVKHKSQPQTQTAGRRTSTRTRRRSRRTRKKTRRGGRKWSTRYKRSIHCNRPKGFSQKQYCKYGRGK